MSFVILRLLLLFEFMLSLCFLVLCVWYIDSCWTIPCLSTDYQVNLLKSTVSQSVSSVVWGTCMMICPLVALYLLYTRCRAFTGGVLCGSYMLVSLAALLQAIAWGDSWMKLMSLVEEELLIFGYEYELNTEYRSSTRTMCLLAACIAILDSTTCLFLLCTRHQVLNKTHTYILHTNITHN